MTKACSDVEFIELFEQSGTAGTARHLGIDRRAVLRRRSRLETRLSRQIEMVGAAPATRQSQRQTEHPQRAFLDIENGAVLVGSDAHYWPGKASTAHRALVRFAGEMNPQALIMNGDVTDCASISRHPPIGWERRPTLVNEIEAGQIRMAEIEDAVPAECSLVWPLGNHDSRFETRLATVAPEFAKIKGVHLSDHFSERWEPCWSAWINDAIVIKHRYKGGAHAAYNNAVGSGKTIVTGHLHSLKVSPFTDYNGTRWGVETGTLADPNGKQFVDYSEDNPKPHQSGFIVLTIRDYELLWPEVVYVRAPGEVEFRGNVIRV